MRYSARKCRFRLGGLPEDGSTGNVGRIKSGGRPCIHNCTLVNPRPGKAVGFYRDGKKVETLKGKRFVVSMREALCAL